MPGILQGNLPGVFNSGITLSDGDISAPGADVTASGITASGIAVLNDVTVSGTVEVNDYITASGVVAHGDIVLSRRIDHQYTAAAGIGIIWLREADGALMLTTSGGDFYASLTKVV